MKIVIPFTLPGLNDYIRELDKNRHKGAEMKRQCQSAVAAVMRRQIRGKLHEPVRMRYLWVEKDRRRDKDNVSAFGRKVIQDALVSTQKLRNDGWNNIEGFSDDFSVDKRKPRIEIIIEEVNDQGGERRD